MPGDAPAQQHTIQQANIATSLLAQWHHGLWRFKEPAKEKKMVSKEPAKEKKKWSQDKVPSDTHKSGFKNKNSIAWENNQIKDYYFENKNKTEQSKSLLGRENRQGPQMACSAHQNLTKSLIPNWFKCPLDLAMKWTLNIPARQPICPVPYTVCGFTASERTFAYFRYQPFSFWSHLSLVPCLHLTRAAAFCELPASCKSKRLYSGHLTNIAKFVNSSNFFVCLVLF